MKRNRRAVLWALATGLLAGVGQAIGQDLIPLPREWAWSVPILVALFAAATPQVQR